MSMFKPTMFLSVVGFIMLAYLVKTGEDFTRALLTTIITMVLLWVVLYVIDGWVNKDT